MSNESKYQSKYLEEHVYRTYTNDVAISFLYVFINVKFIIINVKSSLAQLAERKTVNLEATGSIPVGRDLSTFCSGDLETGQCSL